VTGDALDGEGSESGRPSGATSDEGETSVWIEATGAAEAVVVEAVDEVPEGSFLEKAFFSLARLF
jgi:hypothetical protein